jgi:hypothetical protein
VSFGSHKLLMCRMHSVTASLKVTMIVFCNFRPIPSSDSCKPVVAMQKYRDTDSVLGFLQGLNDPYNQARSQILMLDPMHSLE